MRILLIVAALALVMPASAQTITRPIVAGTRHGCLDVSEGAAWTGYTSASLEDSAGSGALGAGLVMTYLLVRNTHATQTLAICLTGSGSCGAGTTNKLIVAAGAVLTLDLYGVNVTTISLQGSGAATTGQVCAHTVPN